MRPLVISAGTAISALGHGAAPTLAAIQQRRSGLVPCDFSGVTDGYMGRVAGVEDHSLPTVLQRFDCRNNRLADMALNTDGFSDAVAEARAYYGPARIAVIMGTSTSGILSSEQAYARRDRERGTMPAGFDQQHTQDLFSLPRYVAAALSLEGACLTVSNACASSSHAFMDAWHWIEAGVCDAAIVGGADSLCGMTLRGFGALGLVDTRPTRPCDAQRHGISIGEAAGFALVERAGIRPRTQVAGYGATFLGGGASSDGHHMSAPDPQGRGAIAAMQQALDRAGLAASEIDYINMHGTGSVANDVMEDGALHAVFGDRVACSSTKGWTGHTLGASGILEAMICGLCIQEGLVPGGLNIEQVDPDFRSRIVVDNAEKPVKYVMSNAFGFGGTNCSLVFGAAG